MAEKQVKLLVPIRVLSVNVKEHHMVRHKRVKRQREMMYLMLMQARNSLPPFPVSVKFTYYGKRRLDRDNLIAGLKGQQDEIAKFYGVNDGDLRWRWLEPDQVTGQKVDYAVGVDITSI